MNKEPQSDKRWKRKSRKELVKDRWISLYADQCQLPGGQIIEPFYVLEEKEWVHVVAVDTDGTILLTRLYRYPADWFGWELPCGAVDPGEDPLTAAKRELKEETGYIADQWQQVALLYANPARQTNRMYCFVATGLTKAGPQALDVTEDIEFEFVAPAEVLNRLANGQFCHALHVACYFIAADTMGIGRK